MTQFGVDLPSHEAERFDSAYFGFVARELSLAPDIETRLVGYSVTSVIQRRIVVMSCPASLCKFSSLWRSNES